MEASTIDIPVRLTLAESDSEITRIHVDPGDYIVVSIKDRITEDQSRALAAQVKEKFPDNEVLVLHGGITLSVAKTHSAEPT